MYEDEKGVYIVQEYLSGGEVFFRLMNEKFFNEPEAANIIRPVIDAIRYCHELQICHRDLKLENILYTSKDENRIKVTDFSLARILPDEIFATTACGSKSYVAPEIIAGEGYSKNVDYWSLGVILYTLLSGHKPFDSDNDDDLFKKITSGEYSFESEEWSYISDGAKDLISKLLETNPEKRLTAEEIMNHPWMMATEDLGSEDSESDMDDE